MADEVEQKIEAPRITPPSDGARREGQFTDTTKQGTWMTATEGYRTSQKDSTSMEALNDADIERIKKNGYEKFEIVDPSAEPGPAEETGTVIDYKPTQTGEKSYALGMDYEEERDTRSVYEKLADFGKASAARATDPEGQQAYIQGQLDKIIGIGEGLNIAKDSTKAAVVAGWTALTDGTVANFLQTPSMIRYLNLGMSLDMLTTLKKTHLVNGYRRLLNLEQHFEKTSPTSHRRNLRNYS